MPTADNKSPTTARGLIVGAAVVAALAAMAITAAADEPALCGSPGGAPVEVQARVVAAQTPEVFRDKEFVAYQEKDTFTMWTFTLPGHPAHPTVVCRRPVRSGETITLQMDIACKAAEKPCADLSQQFKELNAQMQTAIENGTGGKP
jgi:hypothetical protein